MTEVLTRDEWAKLRRHGYAKIWDGRRYALRLDRITGATVYREVTVVQPLIERHRREDA